MCEVILILVQRGQKCTYTTSTMV